MSVQLTRTITGFSKLVCAFVALVARNGCMNLCNQAGPDWSKIGSRYTVYQCCHPGNATVTVPP